MFNLYILLNRQWLSLGPIDRVFAKLAILLPEIQLMLFEKVFYYLCKLQLHKCVLVDNVINILPNIHILVFPFNFSEN